MTAKKYKDDISTLKSFTDIENCEVIKNQKNLEIEFTPNDKNVEEKYIPDWFSNLRIDKK